MVGVKVSSVQFSCSFLPNSLWYHGMQCNMLPCLSLTPGAYSNSCLLNPWCHPTISSSVTHFSSCLQSFPASGSFFSNGSVLLIRWPKYWSFSFSINPPNEYSGLISLRLTGSPCCPRDSQESCSTPLFKSMISLVLSFLYSPTLVSIHEYWKKTVFLPVLLAFSDGPLFAN